MLEWMQRHLSDLLVQYVHTCLAQKPDIYSCISSNRDMFYAEIQIMFLEQCTRKRTQLQHFLKKLLFEDSFWDSVRTNGCRFIFFEDFFGTVYALTDTASTFFGETPF